MRIFHHIAVMDPLYRACQNAELSHLRMFWILQQRINLSHGAGSLVSHLIHHTLTLILHRRNNSCH